MSSSDEASVFTNLGMKNKEFLNSISYGDIVWEKTFKIPKNTIFRPGADSLAYSDTSIDVERIIGREEFNWDINKNKSHMSFTFEANITIGFTDMYPGLVFCRHYHKNMKWIGEGKIECDSPLPQNAFPRAKNLDIELKYVVPDGVDTSKRQFFQESAKMKFIAYLVEAGKKRADYL